LRGFGNESEADFTFWGKPAVPFVCCASEVKESITRNMMNIGFIALFLLGCLLNFIFV
jgi:hypothetical protein